MKRIIILFCLLISVAKVYCQDAKIYFTNNNDYFADITIGYPEFPYNSTALKVYVDPTSYTGLKFCFVDEPTYGSINVEIVNDSKNADKRICLTTNSLYANKTISITDKSYSADISVRFCDTPSSSSQNIYIKGINPMVLSVEAKLAILYVLGLLNK